VVAGGSAGTKRRAAEMLSDFEFKAKPGAPASVPFGEVEQRLLPPLLGGGRAKGQDGAGARASGLSGGRDGGGHGGRVWLGWETTRRNDDNGNGGRKYKRSAVMRVCTTGEGSGSGLGAGGYGNEQ
jgi:hypothetical protein